MSTPDLTVQPGGGAGERGGRGRRRGPRPPYAAAEEVAALNDDHALVLLGDKPAVLREFTDADGRRDFRLLSVAGFHEWMRPRVVLKDGRYQQVSKLWLQWAGRRQYENIIFAPRQDTPGYYNLWRGFAVEPDPKAGTFDRLMDHLYTNVCQRDTGHFAWVLGWFAQIVQRPTEKLGTSLVLRGTQGTGKSIVGAMFGSLLGAHHQAVSDTRYLTGRFNSHLVNCLLLQLDEATWGGDHQAAGKLKDLVTGAHQLIEYKGREPVKVQNYVRLFITGNNQWLVPAGPEERRFAVFEMGEAQRQNHAYFAAITAELDGGVKGPGSNGGRQALLAYLLEHDLSTVNLREIPKTAALYDQKVASLSSEQKWWLDTLRAGQLPGPRGHDGLTPAALLYDHYIEHAKKIGENRRSIETTIGRFLRQTVPGLERAKRTLQSGQPDVPCYQFPPLRVCRAAFDAITNQPADWPDVHAEWSSTTGGTA